MSTMGFQGPLWHPLVPLGQWVNGDNGFWDHGDLDHGALGPWGFKTMGLCNHWALGPWALRPWDFVTIGLWDHWALTQ